MTVLLENGCELETIGRDSPESLPALSVGNTRASVQGWASLGNLGLIVAPISEGLTDGQVEPAPGVTFGDATGGACGFAKR